MADANFRAMLCATNDSATYFDAAKRAIMLEAAGDPRAEITWHNVAKRGARLEMKAGGDLTGFDPAICGAMIRDHYAEEISAA